MDKILYLVPHLQSYSVTTHLYDLLKYINRKAYEPIILTLYPERENSDIQKFYDLDISIIQANLRRWQIMQQVLEFRKIVRNVCPDLIHSVAPIADIICLLSFIHTPWVMTQHSFQNGSLVHSGNLFKSKIIALLDQQAIRRADCVIPCSYSMRDQYKQMIPRNYIPIQNGIEIEEWGNTYGMSKIDFRKKLNLPEDKFIFLSTGRIVDVKDPLLLIKSFISLKFKDSCLVMLGNGQLEKACKDAAKDHNDIIFPGYVSNVKDYLYAADIFVSASKSEGLPYAVLEAECASLPMLLSDIPQHKEVLVGGTRGVKFFPVGDQKRLTELMKASARSPVLHASYDLTRFTTKGMSEQYQKVYANLLYGTSKNSNL